MKKSNSIASKYLKGVSNTAIYLKNFYGENSKCISVASMESACLLANAYHEWYLCIDCGKFIRDNYEIESFRKLEGLMETYSISTEIISEGENVSLKFLERELKKVISVIDLENPTELYVGEENALSALEMQRFYFEYQWMKKYHLYLPDGLEQMELISKKMQKAVKGKVGCKFKFNEKKKVESEGVCLID